MKKLFGKTIDPFKSGIFKKTALVSFLAWIGLGADGLSSACYGPEQAYRALGNYHALSLFVALGMVLSVFIIALSYNQVIELFPSGGGGYKVSSQLLGPLAGVVAGSALIVDYVLTIAISTASGADAIYSFFPSHWHASKLSVECGLVLFFIFMNLRGMKESIRFVMPLFLAFIITHLVLIFYGIAAHRQSMAEVVHQSYQQAHGLSHLVGPLFMIAFVLHAFSLGSGTYTGIEAVSNNVNKLMEPRVKTGKLTMLYMAVSLSIMAGGITLLYMLWHVKPVAGQTLNAVVFSSMLGTSSTSHVIYIVTLLLEGGILLVAANTGFLAGPNVLANMAVDNWMPKRFQCLSNRLVSSQGIIFFGLAALLILIFSEGKVAWLVVLYSVNVFITFSLTTLGMSSYWLSNRKETPRWFLKLSLSLLGFILTSFILYVVIVSKFFEGGYVTLLITCAVIIFCYLVRRHYSWVGRALRQRHRALVPMLDTADTLIQAQPLDSNKQTAIIYVNDKITGMHCLQWILKHLPDYFENFVFISVGQVDIKSFSGKRALKRMNKEVETRLQYFVSYCQSKSLSAVYYAEYGGDVIEHLMSLCRQTRETFPKHMFFASQMVFKKDTWFKRFLHNSVTYILERRLHAMGDEILLLPMRLSF